jgi:hypothetical protein
MMLVYLPRSRRQPPGNTVPPCTAAGDVPAAVQVVVLLPCTAESAALGVLLWEEAPGEHTRGCTIHPGWLPRRLAAPAALAR